MEQRLSNYREIWNKKPVLQAIYKDYYKRIKKECTLGSILEIGGGSGNLKEYLPTAKSLDILYASWLDLIADAHVLPFKSNSFDNIILFDVLHHLQQPRLFFKEANRVLKTNGRLILLEPAITPVSWLFYNFLHQELVDMSIDPLSKDIIASNEDPFDSNQAIPTLLFGRYIHDFNHQFPHLKILKHQFLSFLGYPLSGGFKNWSLIPLVLIPPLLKFEEVLAPYIGKLIAFRTFIVLEKVEHNN